MTPERQRDGKAELSAQRRVESCLRGAKKLDLSGLDITALPGGIRYAHHVNVIDVSKTKIQEIPGWICELSNLRKLLCGNSTVSHIPRSIGSLKPLEELDLFQAPVGGLPGSMKDLGNLRKLDISSTHLTEVPEWLGNLASLEELRCSSIPIFRLPLSIANLKRLKHLDIWGTRTRVLPEFLGELSSLEYLSFSRTDVSILPSFLSKLQKLKHLSFSRTLVTVLPDFIGQLESLRYLYLSRTPVNALPDTVGSLRNLRHLDASGTAITALPVTLGQLTELEQLNVSKTSVSDVPPSIAELTELRHLDLSSTKIDRLPSELAKLTKLERFDFSNTAVSILPEFLAELTNLAQLDFTGAPITSPPPEIIAQGVDAVLAYLKDLHDGEKQWRSKLVLAGEAQVGKTSLVKGLTGQLHDPHEPMTHGVTITDIPIAHPTESNVIMHLSAWDFGGQRTYRSAHRFYMTDRSLFLLVFNCRDEWDDRRMREWLKAISARAAESPILLVGTHSREHRHGLPLATLRKDFPRILEKIFYVDCADTPERIGIEELLSAITREAAALPLMGALWPATYLRAVDAVDVLPGDYASLEAVDKAMKRAGLADAGTRTALLAALHYRGDILHFADEADIAETVVLRPTWVDAHVTKILDSHNVHDRAGILSRDELKSVWPETENSLREHLIGLMEAFDLAYRIDSPEHSDVCLIVDRLPHDPPDFSESWRTALDSYGADEVRLIVDFGAPVLLAGIPTWFIAREHRFTTNTHWRYGVLLLDHFDTGCYALLKADDNRGIVELAVRGVAPVRFLAVLKDGLLNPLRQRYQYLTWKILVPCPCREDDGEACDYAFDEVYLDKVVQNSPERTSVECQTSLREVPIDRLRYGLHPTSLKQIATDLAEVRSTVRRIEKVQMSGLDFQRQVTALQSAQSERCPSVFTIAKRDRKLFHGHGKLIWRERYELRLFCEQPNEWHPVGGPKGAFVFTKRPKWLDSCAPFLRILLPILEHTLPLVGPAIGIAKDISGSVPGSVTEFDAELWSEERLNDELEGMRLIVESIPKGLADEQAESGFSEMLVFGKKNPLRRATHYADFRALRKSLEAVAPRNKDPWCGLIPMITPEGIAIFVCRGHARQYDYPRLK